MPKYFSTSRMSSFQRKFIPCSRLKYRQLLLLWGTLPLSLPSVLVFRNTPGQLNLYGFQRIDDGPEKGGFVHQYFQKGQRSLCNRIKRQRNKPAGSPASFASTIVSRGGAARPERGLPPSATGVGGGSGVASIQGCEELSAADDSVPQNMQAQAVLQRLLRETSEEGKRDA